MTNVRYNPSLGRQARGVSHIQPMVTTRQAFGANILKDALALPDGQASVSLTDVDGKQQFILGVTPLTSDVRMGTVE
jgi:hypothetical protein